MFFRSLSFAFAVGAPLLVDPAEGFAAKVHYLTASMPQELADWTSCDETLWNEFPPGSKKDLLRFVESDMKEFATNRVASIRDILPFVHEAGDGKSGDPFIYDNWDKGMTAWENNNVQVKLAAKLEAKQRLKEERAEKRKIEAAKKAAEEAAAANEEEDFQ